MGQSSPRQAWLSVFPNQMHPRSANSDRHNPAPRKCRPNDVSRWAVALLFLLFSFVFGGSLFAATSGPSPVPSIFDPASTPAHDIYHLSLFVMAICAGIFAVVFTLIIYATIKYRRRATDDDCEPPQVYGSNQVELAWTVIPVLIVVVLFLASARVIHAVEDAQFPPDAIEVTATDINSGGSFNIPSMDLSRQTSCMFRSVQTGNRYPFISCCSRPIPITAFGCRSWQGRRT